MAVNEAESHPATHAGCPHEYARKTVPPVETPQQWVEQGEDGVWNIYGFEEVRQVLRNGVAQQAGFAAEIVLHSAGNLMKNPPILYLEGEEHHRARRETNRFFTPAVTDREYRDFMDAFADSLMKRLQREKRADLSDLSMDMAVQVAAQIVGLTSSVLPGLKGRLEAMIAVGDQQLNHKRTLLSMIQSQWHVASFYLLDVLPAIRARRKQPREDVISYLIERDYNGLEVLTECIVYGVAGMVTTREFISVALWHLLERPALMERMRVGEQEERYAILHEILRLEPVVGTLYRHLQDDLTLETDGQTVTIPAGSRVNLHISSANVDERAVGEPGASLCPMREMASMRPKVPSFALSFGDGSHRCPGAYVAIQESDIFLRKLLALPGLRIKKKPEVSYFKVAESYEIRDFILAVD